MGKMKYAKLVKYAPNEVLETVDIPYIRDSADLPIPWPFTKFGKSLDGLLKEKGFNVIKKGFDSNTVCAKGKWFEGNRWFVGGELNRVYENLKECVKIDYSHIVNFKRKLEEPITYLGELRKMLLGLTSDEEEIHWVDKRNFIISTKGFYKLFTNDESGSVKFELKTKESIIKVDSEDEVSYGIHGRVSKNELTKFMLKKDSDERIDSGLRYCVDEYPINEENAKKYIFDVLTNLAKD